MRDVDLRRLASLGKDLLPVDTIPEPLRRAADTAHVALRAWQYDLPSIGVLPVDPYHVWTSRLERRHKPRKNDGVVFWPEAKGPWLAALVLDLVAKWWRGDTIARLAAEPGLAHDPAAMAAGREAVAESQRRLQMRVFHAGDLLARVRDSRKRAESAPKADDERNIAIYELVEQSRQALGKTVRKTSKRLDELPRSKKPAIIRDLGHESIRTAHRKGRDALAKRGRKVPE